MQFYTLMIDYGRDGREAIVNPEETRVGILKEARDLLANPRGRTIAFIWNVRAGEPPEDITKEIIAEAQDALVMDAAE